MLVRHRRHHRRRRSHQSSAIISIAGDGRDRKQRNSGYDNCRSYDPEIDHLVYEREVDADLAAKSDDLLLSHAVANVLHVVGFHQRIHGCIVEVVSIETI
jgi:hypothetical protein